MNKDQQITALKKENDLLTQAVKSSTHLKERIEEEAKLYAKKLHEAQTEIKTIAEKFGFEVINNESKMVSVDIVTIMKSNGIKSTRMTLAETKKLTFALQNLFQELKAHGE